MKKITWVYLMQAIILVNLLCVFVAYVVFFSRIPAWIHLTLWYVILIKLVYTAFLVIEERINENKDDRKN